MKINPLRIDTSDKDFGKKILKRVKIHSNINQKVQVKVDSIISTIRKNGDKSLMGFIRKFDNYNIRNIKKIIISSKEIKEAYKYVDK
ncbi:histidinol dehydrogenase, partial [Gammaproteobacteria bacterium]|nr:histidinol dehydrogenase [Gammaproteobacteria bacterium]